MDDVPPQVDVRRRIVGGVVTVAVVLLVFVGLLPRFAEYDAVWGVLGRISAGRTLGLAVLALWFLGAYWLVLMAVLPTLRLREAAVNHSAGTAVTNTVPAGGAVALALNYAMYASWGFTPHAITSGILTAGAADNLMKVAIPAVALGVLALGSSSAAVAWTVPAAGLAVVVMSVAINYALLRSDELAARLGRIAERVASAVLRLVRRPPVRLADRAVTLRRNLVAMLRRRWRQLAAATVANHAAMFAVLYAALRATGVGAADLGFVEILAAFSVARLLSGVPITPGGIGVVEAGYVALLTLGTPEAVHASVVAGVLLFRGLTFFPPIALGLVSWLWWRTNRAWRQDWRVAGRGEFVDDPHRLVVEGYDRLASGWDEWNAEVIPPLYDDYLDRLERELPEGRAVLELGCGTGVPVGRRLADRYRYTGIDGSPGMLDRARANVPGGTFHLGDMRTVDVVGPFAAVVAFYTIIHVPRDDQPALVSRIFEWLEPGGMLIVSLTAGDRPGGWEHDWLGAGPMFWSGFASDENLRMLEDAGFTIESSELRIQYESGEDEVVFHWVVARRPVA